MAVSSRRVSRRHFLRRAVQTGAAGAAGAIVAATGCSRRRKVYDGTVTLDFYNYSNPEWRYYYTENLIPAFEKKHRGIKVRFRTVQVDVAVTSRASGSCPNAARPPSTGMVAPVMKLASAERR